MILSRTPFRMSFLGGGTDFPSFYNQYGGLCLATTIDKYSYLYLRKIKGDFGFKNEFIYSTFERTSEDVDTIRHPIIRETMRLEGVNNLRIDYDADIPARTGLGTSSSFSVGLVNSLNVLKGVQLSKREIADKAIYIERVLCKESGGIQDQISSSFGGLNLLIFNKHGYEVEKVRISAERKCRLESNLMLFYTGVQRTSSLIQKSIKLEDSAITKNLLALKSLAQEGFHCLQDESKDLDDFGRLLHEAWLNKKKLSASVSTALIENMYMTGIEAGALGGKILGAGGGGFLLLYVPEAKHEDVRRAFKEYLEIKFNFEDKGTEVLYAG